jgi:succinate-semialdehyde dehydrogenase / glutarate-semialdehyde dehydrogenase
VRPVYEAFREALAQHAKKLDVGDQLASDCALGPLINEKIYRNSEAYVADARNKGARIVTGGERLRGGIYDHGFFLPPTVVATPITRCW